MYTTVVVCTIGRESLTNTLKTLANNSVKSFELFIVSQGSLTVKKKVNSLINTYKDKIHKLKHFHLTHLGLSKSRNFAIRKFHSQLLVFVDDDCMVESNWLENIEKSFLSDQKIDVVFGRVLPYKPELHKGFMCISITSFKNTRIYKSPLMYNRAIFPGNSMAIKRDVFLRMGFFKEWLGVGSHAYATEDEEMAFRILRTGGRILVNSDIISYHNRWLKRSDYHSIMKRYTCGFFAAFTYHALKGDKIAKGYIKSFLIRSASTWIRHFLKSVCEFHPKVTIFYLGFLLSGPTKWIYYIKGILIGDRKSVV